MTKRVKLTESDLNRIVKKVIKEENESNKPSDEYIIKKIEKAGKSVPQEDYDDVYDWMSEVFSDVEIQFETKFGGNEWIDDLRTDYDEVLLDMWEGNDDEEYDDDEERGNQNFTFAKQMLDMAPDEKTALLMLKGLKSTKYVTVPQHEELKKLVKEKFKK